MASATSSRGASSSTKRSPSAFSSVAPSPRTASVIRKPSRGPSSRSAVGWNCMNSRSASTRAGVAREAEPGAHRSARVCGARPERGHAAGGEDHARAPRARAARRRVAATVSPAAAAVVGGNRGGGERLEHLDALVGGRERRQRARDPPPGGRAAGVHDAALRVPALEPEREVAVAVGVELHAEPLEVAHALGRLLAEHAHGAGAGGLAAGGEGVLGVLRGRVVHPPARRRSRPAPSSWPSAPAASGSRARRSRPRAAATSAA